MQSHGPFQIFRVWLEREYDEYGFQHDSLYKEDRIKIMKFLGASNQGPGITL